MLGIGEASNEPDEEKEEADTEIIKALMTMLKEAVEELDIDVADETVAKLDGYILPDEISKDLDTLKAAVADLDSDNVSEIVDKILENLQ